jgi:hypothetical protein
VRGYIAVNPLDRVRKTELPKGRKPDRGARAHDRRAGRPHPAHPANYRPSFPPSGSRACGSRRLSAHLGRRRL